MMTSVVVELRITLLQVQLAASKRMRCSLDRVVWSFFLTGRLRAWYTRVVSVTEEPNTSFAQMFYTASQLMIGNNGIDVDGQSDQV